MSLEAPKLDKRKFEEIFREAQLRIPSYTPEWTDFNESDPGITLLQLFSWLSEMMLFQMNQMPERNYIKFLDLLGMQLSPAQAATAHLTFAGDPETGPDDLFTPIVPPLTQIEAPPTEAGNPLIYETERGISLIRRPLTHVQVFDGSSFTKVTEANTNEDVSFRPFGWNPQIGNALYLGFEAFLDEDDKPIPAPAGIFPQEIGWRVFKLAADLRGQPQLCEGADVPPITPVRLVWEYKPEAKSRFWQRLDVFNDASIAFTREGYIQIEGPGEIAATRVGKVEEPCYWLRCRIDSGSYPAGENVSIDFIRPNTVNAINLSTIRQELIGVSDGLPFQLISLRFVPVQSDSIQLEVESQTLPLEKWERVDDFLASKQDDLHYVLDPVRGEVRFGDGKNGRIPIAGANIVATHYRYGGGKAGNVGAGLIATLTNPPEGVSEVTNIRQAEGGQDAQTIEDLKKQAPGQLRSRNRAVTEDDFTALTERAGGVARAKAIALAHDRHPGIDVPGSVMVVILPDNDEPNPQPSSDLIQSVCRYLYQYRLLTTEVTVKGPTYYPVKVVAKVQADSYFSADEVKRNIIIAVRELLDPLGRKFNSDPTHERPRTWAFGQDLYPSGFYSTLLSINGVRAIEYLELIINNVPQNLNQPFELNDDELFYAADDQEITVVPYEDRMRQE